MITYSKRNGYYYEDETTGERFALVILNSFGGTTTTDIVGILDEESGNLAGWFYGATLLENNPKELDEIVPKYIQKRAEKPGGIISYPFTRDGVRLWLGDVIDDILDEGITGDFVITHANRSIYLPDLAHIYEGLQYFLETSLEEEENA